MRHLTEIPELEYWPPEAFDDILAPHNNFYVDEAEGLSDLTAPQTFRLEALEPGIP